LSIPFKIRQLPPEGVQVLHGFPNFPFPSHASVSLKLSDVFDSFERIELPKLASKTTEASRLARLRKWFGERAVDQLDENFIDNWKVDRLSGKLGSGRNPDRAATMSGDKLEKPLLGRKICT
jgi:hypothetical protein